MACYKAAPPIFPLGPLVEITGWHPTMIGRHAHVSGSRVARMTREGLTLAEADRVAVACGHHPGTVWGELWWSEQLQTEAANRWHVHQLADSLDIGLPAAHVMFAAQLAASEAVKGSLARPSQFFDRTGRQGKPAGRTHTHTTIRSAA